MTEVSNKEMEEMAYDFVTAKQPLFIHGAPGIGKSDGVKAVAKRIAAEKGMEYNEGKIDKAKFNLSDIRVSQLDPSDLRGIPTRNGERTQWLVPDWLPEEGTHGILFLDEINLAPPSIQAACYQLILDRRIGNYYLPEGWAIIAAGNRAVDKANVFATSAPLKNRFSHLTLTVPTEKEWREWAMEAGIHSDVIAFVAFKPSLLFKFDASSKSDAFPTPRTWFKAGTMLNQEKYQKDTAAAAKMIGAWLGEAVSIEFASFLKMKKSIDLDDILANPKKIKDIEDVGTRYSAISGLSEKYRSNKKNMDPILKVMTYMQPDFGVFLLRLMKGVGKTAFVKDLVASKVWSAGWMDGKTQMEPLSGKYQKYLS